jgi:hypothetical protein
MEKIITFHNFFKMLDFYSFFNTKIVNLFILIMIYLLLE